MAAKTYKRLGTAASATEATLYSVPASTEAIISELTVCNKGGTDGTYSIAITTSSSAGATDWKCYLVPIPAYSFVLMNPGYAMQASSKIRIVGSSTDIVFSCSGVELS